MQFQQYYPTYNYTERDIVLVEFEEAQKIANSQSKLYGQLANFLIAFVTIGITLLLKAIDNSTNQLIVVVKQNVILFNVFLGIIGLVILRYFIELQRTIVINSRKVITLRRMLGLDYGYLQLTIPNWRVEGATNPFEIKLFPGWLKFSSSPFWIITITLNIFWYLSFLSINNDFITKYWYVINILITIFYAFIFRLQLNEIHESFYLLIVKNISNLLKIKLIKNFEYILYRSKLSVNERDRLNYKTHNVEQLLIAIEDSRFYKHKGIDFKSILRSVLSLSKIYRKKKGLLKSGGSTITMQLCRTLLIPSNQNKIRRKAIEILLSIWCERQFSKTNILAFYLTSVRFEKRINGIIAATKYFFPNKKEKTYSNEEAFFLIERLSNISSTYRKERIKSLFDRIPSSIQINWKLLLSIYEEKEKNNMILKCI